MHHLISIFCIVVAMIVISGIAMAFRKYLQHRRENAAPFRGYFGPQYHHELLQFSSLSETGDRKSDAYSRILPLHLRDPDAARRFTPVSGPAQRNKVS